MGPMSASLALAPFEPDDIARAIAAIDDSLSHLVSRGADLILQSGTPLAISFGPQGLVEFVARLHASPRAVFSGGSWHGT